MGLTLQSILEVNMDKETLTSLAWLKLEWKDPFLLWWDFTKFDSYKEVPALFKRSGSDVY